MNYWEIYLFICQIYNLIIFINVIRGFVLYLTNKYFKYDYIIIFNNNIL